MSGSIGPAALFIWVNGLQVLYCRTFATVYTRSQPRNVSVNFTAFFDTHNTISAEKRSKRYVSVNFPSIFDTHDKNMAETPGEWNVSVNYYEIFGTHIYCYV